MIKVGLMATNSRHPCTFSLNREFGTDDYLFVLFKSPAKLWVNDQYVSVNYGSCVLFDKRAKQSYFPDGEIEFLHDFIHFDFDKEMERALLHGVPKNVALRLLSPSRISDSLAIIEQEQRLKSPYQNEILSSACEVFIFILKSEANNSNLLISKHKHYDTFYNLRKEIYKNPAKDWNIDSIAKDLLVSRSYLQHMYKDFFGRPCTEEVIIARINHAKILLTNENLSILEVAEKCGYNSVEHFIRQFSKLVGVTPLKYRKNPRKLDIT